VSGDYDGDIKVFYVFSKPKHSSLPETSVVPAAVGGMTGAGAPTTN
jgi:hypothetical protein